MFQSQMIRCYHSNIECICTIISKHRLKKMATRGIDLILLLFNISIQYQIK